MTHEFLVQGLSLITSCGCNLNCEYCRIAQSVNSSSAGLQHATIKALQDGTYRENVKNVLYKLGQSPMAISSIAFWGQEPTLTLHHITDHLEEWFELFPNWNNTMFSTNTVAHMDRIVDFCVKLDKVTKRPFDLNIQLSYDGDYSTDNLRGASSSSIHDNVEYLLTELNKHTFNKLQIRLHHHAVLSLDLLSKLQNTDALLAHSRNLKEWAAGLSVLNNNSHVILSDEVDIGLENPVEASTEQGMQLDYLCRLDNRLEMEHEYRDIFPYKEIPPSISQQLYGGLFQTFDNIIRTLREEFNIHNLDQGIDLMSQDSMFKLDFLNQLNPSLYCGNGVSELKIMYDGTLINCQNHIYEQNADLIPNDGTLANSVKRALAQHNYFINPLTETDRKVIDKYFDMFRCCKFHSLPLLYKTTVTTMLYLVNTRQISESYFDERKLYKHALILAINGACSYNNQIMTSSLFMRHSGYIRFMCNGFLDQAVGFFNGMHGEEIL
jgi:organic radical activating enzyme